MSGALEINDACPFGLVRLLFQECFRLHCLGRGVENAPVSVGLCEWRLQSVVLK